MLQRPEFTTAKEEAVQEAVAFAIGVDFSDVMPEADFVRDLGADVAEIERLRHDIARLLQDNVPETLIADLAEGNICGHLLNGLKKYKEWYQLIHIYRHSTYWTLTKNRHPDATPPMTLRRLMEILES